MKRKTAWNNKQGLTLVELTVVLALTAIIGAIAVAVSTGSLGGMRTRACQSSRGSIYTYWVMRERMTGDDTYTLEQAIAYCLAAQGEDAVQACPNGGGYYVEYEGSGANKIPLGVGCTKHSAQKSTIEETLQQDMQAILDRVNAGDKTEVTYAGNTVIRKYMYEQNGNQWPSLTIDGKTLYIQPYYNSTTKEITIFALPTSELKDNWSTAYLFDSVTQTWYVRKTAGGAEDASTAWMGWSIETRHEKLSGGYDRWQAVPADSIVYNS